MPSFVSWAIKCLYLGSTIADGLLRSHLWGNIRPPLRSRPVEQQRVLVNIHTNVQLTLRPWRENCHECVPDSAVLELTGSSNMLTMLRSRWLSWFGHVCCVWDEHYYMKNWHQPPATRPVGRPRLCYKDVLKWDLKSSGTDRDSWRGACRGLRRGAFSRHSGQRTHCQRQRWNHFQIMFRK